ncbi:RNA 2',3'-cyclic phosphodiesterase [Aquibacillus albus]|uniref:RNA 2',3'-cyclic phosphodiesterase n=1 Tax=Aquibacillus albus TaxID=1168171 RepID=A0ABS2N3Z2_9BACI|nr:RNA 2',3'-cyclic phosphodiesterase [Aquibacillus albus]MBM7572821.1 2'-5' RNA ligase [Aquibacillus albus]
MTQHEHFFVAVPLSSSIKAMLADWQTKLQHSNSLNYKNWTHPDDLHITLKFLGAVDREKMIQLNEALDTLCNVPSFSITVGGVDTFGSPRQPRVLWAAIERSRELEHLYTFVESTCMKYGFKKENRPYRPHITLAKKWDGKQVQPETLGDIISSFRDRKESVVNHFVVYQIHPKKTPKYEIIKQVDLK